MQNEVLIMGYRVWTRLRQLGCKGLGILLVGLVLLVGIGQSPAAAIGLGEKLSADLARQTHFDPVGERGISLRAVTLTPSSEETVEVVTNHEGVVFLIDINSTGRRPPQKQLYMGEYTGLQPLDVRLIPLRGRIETYKSGAKEAEWSVFGLSGRFRARAFSHDLAPAEVMEEE